METKHTSGPWKVDQVAGGYNIWVYGDVSKFPVSSHRLARVGGELSESDIIKQNSKANARLIAAAPELLEACKGLMKMIDDGILVRNIEEDHKGNFGLRMLPLMKILTETKAAIEKAEKGA